MKVVIIGSSLSGKTTLIRYLRAYIDLLLSEIDEELTRLNNEEYPTDTTLKHIRLAPQIVKDILNRENIIFFTNTDYFTYTDLKEARKKGFKVIQLSVDLEQLQKRNKSRVEKENYEDASEWFEGMIDYQKKIQERGLVDNVIDASQPTEAIAKELLQFLK